MFAELSVASSSCCKRAVTLVSDSFSMHQVFQHGSTGVLPQQYLCFHRALITTLFSHHPTYTALPDQIGLERSRLIELEEKANSLQGKIGTQRKAMGGINAAREASIQVLLLTLSCGNTITTVTSTS